MEVALNKESKRKTPAVLAFRDGNRYVYPVNVFAINIYRGSIIILLEYSAKMRKPLDCDSRTNRTSM